MTEKKISLILGKRGSGKTVLSKYLLQNYNRLIVFDTLGEYTEGVVFYKAQELAKFWHRCYRKNFRLIYRPMEPETEIELIAKLVWLCGDICFCVEEIDKFGTAWKISKEFAQIIQRGRHNNITLIGITQRPYGIHRLLTSQAKELFIFNTNEPRDREYLRNLLGQEVPASLDQLSEYECIKWMDGSDKLERGKIENNVWTEIELIKQGGRQNEKGDQSETV